MDKRALFLLLGLAAPITVLACGDDTTSGDTTGGGNASAQGCEPAAGCPSVTSDCIAVTDNAGKDKFALRISHLSISEPAALTDPTVSALLTKGITLDFDECRAATGDPIFTGDGTFSWILEFDKTAGQLRTGGARLQTDPVAGYCFANETIGGFPVAPFQVPLPLGADGSFDGQTTKAVTVPIYTNPMDASQVIILPLRGVRLYEGKVSTDNNCIGSYNGAALDPNNLCKPEADVPFYVTGAKLEGHITLEDADTVLIPELGSKSLCWLLVPSAERDGDRCRRDPGTQAITFQGDWCTGATPDDPGTAGGCADSVRLGASFAASGATLLDGC
jgi:hypothetical protein